MTDIHPSGYRVEVLVRQGSEYVWKPMRPTRGEPYVFTEDEARAQINAHVRTSGKPDRYRMTAVFTEEDVAHYEGETGE